MIPIDRGDRNSPMNIRKTGRLSQEGIVAVELNGDMRNNTHPSILSSDQIRMEITPDRRICAKVSKILTPTESSKEKPIFLDRSDWISLGSGWFQTTPTGSGVSKKSGLHSVIESFPGKSYYCAYEPLTEEVSKACISNYPIYDCEVSAKIIREQGTKLLSQFQLVFAMKSTDDYYSLLLSASHKKW